METWTLQAPTCPNSSPRPCFLFQILAEEAKSLSAVNQQR